MPQLTNIDTGRTYEAVDVHCDCGATGCEVTIRVPVVAVEPPAGMKPYTPKKRRTVVHNLVQGRRLFRYPVVG